MKNETIRTGGLRLSILSLFAAAAFVITTLTCSAQKTTVTREALSVDVAQETPPAAPGDCPEINWPLHLEGTSQTVITDTVRKGVHYMLIHHLVTGTATDAEGNTFGFTYINNFRTSFNVSTGETLVNFDTDHFGMHGPSGNLSVGFVGSLIFGADGSFQGIEIDHSYGNVACDPI